MVYIGLLTVFLLFAFTSDLHGYHSPWKLHISPSKTTVPPCCGATVTADVAIPLFVAFPLQIPSNSAFCNWNHRWCSWNSLLLRFCFTDMWILPLPSRKTNRTYGCRCRNCLFTCLLLPCVPQFFSLFDECSYCFLSTMQIIWLSLHIFSPFPIVKQISYIPAAVPHDHRRWTYSTHSSFPLSLFLREFGIPLLRLVVPPTVHCREVFRASFFSAVHAHGRVATANIYIFQVEIPSFVEENIFILNFLKLSFLSGWSFSVWSSLLIPLTVHCCFPGALVLYMTFFLFFIHFYCVCPSPFPSFPPSSPFPSHASSFNVSLSCQVAVSVLQDVTSAPFPFFLSTVNLGAMNALHWGIQLFQTPPSLLSCSFPRRSPSWVMDACAISCHHIEHHLETEREMLFFLWKALYWFYTQRMMYLKLQLQCSLSFSCSLPSCLRTYHVPWRLLCATLSIPPVSVFVSTSVALSREVSCMHVYMCVYL